jgi:hypothetical protein
LGITQLDEVMTCEGTDQHKADLRKLGGSLISKAVTDSPVTFSSRIAIKESREPPAIAVAV